MFLHLKCDAHPPPRCFFFFFFSGVSFLKIHIYTLGFCGDCSHLPSKRSAQPCRGLV